LKVSVVIPVRNDARIGRCVDSVLAASAGLEEVDLEVMVVDNGSELALPLGLSRDSARVNVVNEPMVGPFKARNLGIDTAMGDVIFFTDAPCVVHRDWLSQGLQALSEANAHIVQGYAGSLGTASLDRFIQARYESRFQGLSPGAPVECDTRNLVVQRKVFDEVRFNDMWRRVGDTEFGLAAEHLGFKVAYWPSLRVKHEHESSLRLFLAKQISHGWGAQRLVRTRPNLQWHSGHAREVAGIASTLGRAPWDRGWTRLLLGLTLVGGGALEARLRARAARLEMQAATALDKLSILTGHLLYEAGADEPWPDQVLRKHIRWRPAA